MSISIDCGAKPLMSFVAAVLLSGALAAAGALTRDYCPMAVGNWWEYQGQAGVLKQTIGAMKPGGFEVIDSVWTGGSVSVTSMVFYPSDENGLVEGGFKDYFGMTFFASRDWPVYKSVTVPAGTFSNGVIFRATGHGIMGPVQNIAVGGVGNIAHNCDFADQPSCGFKLKRYQVRTVPEAVSHTWSVAGQTSGAADFSLTRVHADTLRLVFRLKCRPAARFDAMTSYKQLDSSLRVFAADTAPATGTAGGAITEHSLLIGGVRSMPLTRIRVLYREALNNDNLNKLIYDRRVADVVPAQPLLRREPAARAKPAGCGTAGDRRRQAWFATPDGVLDIRGRRVGAAAARRGLPYPLTGGAHP